MQQRKSGFVVYRRQGNKLMAHRAKLFTAGETEDGWPIVDIAVGPEVPWAEIYAGHTAWVGEQVARHRDAVKRSKEERAAKRTGLNKGAV